MTPHLDERRPPGGGREAAASKDKKRKVNKQNSIPVLLRQAGANRCCQPERQPAPSRPAVPTLGGRALPFVVARAVECILERGAPPPRRRWGRP